jgi:hypothetical protein
MRGVPEPPRPVDRFYNRRESRQQANEEYDGAMEDESRAISVGHCKNLLGFGLVVDVATGSNLVMIYDVQ